MAPQTILKLSYRVMAASIVALAVGIYIGFIDHAHWSIASQVVAQVGIMLGAGFLKLGYVMYLNASKHLGINDFAPETGMQPAERPLMECCLAGQPCV